MNKKLSMRMLAGFLAFIMVFFSVSDYSVFAADTTTDVVAEVDADDADSVANVESNDSVDAVVNVDTDTAAVTETVSANNTDDSSIVVDDDVKPVKDFEGFSFTGDNENGAWKIQLDNGSYATFATITNGKVVFTDVKATKGLEIPKNFFTITNGKVEKTNVISITFDNSKVREVAESVFKNCTNLTTVSFTNCPDFTTIQKEAFYGCSSLKTLNLGEKVTTIRADAFNGCAEITEITLPETLVIIEDRAFQNCSSLETINYNMKNVIERNNTEPTKIFDGCKIKNIKFDGNKSGLEVWPAHIFSGATFAPVNGVFEVPARFNSIGRAGLANIKGIKEIKFEAGTQISSFEQAAFCLMPDLEKITIPDSVTAIKWQCFDRCYKLNDVVIPETVTHLGDYAFENCKALTSINIPSGIAPIEGDNRSDYDRAFAGCTSLTSVTIDFNYVGVEMFAGSGLTSVKFGNNARIIGERAFSGTKVNNVDTNYVTSINKEAFSNCDLLTKLTLGNSLNLIDESAFNNCSSLRYINSDSAVVFPNNIKKIGNSAFYNCTSIGKSVTLPANLEEIGNNAFTCDSAKDNMKIETIIIPSKVKRIGDGVFRGNTGLNSVTINTLLLSENGNGCGKDIFAGCNISTVQWPTGIKTIPAYIFYGANFVTGYNMTIPSTVENIGAWAFAGTDSLEGKDHPVNIAKYIWGDGINLKEIGDGAFAHNVQIVDFNLPNTITSIGNSAFLGCTNNKNIVIPEGVLFIGSNAYRNNSSAENIYYNAIACERCGEGVFYGCCIKSIILGDKVKSLPEGLFMDATFYDKVDDPDFKLVTLEIPEEFTELKRNAFANCKNLGEIKFKSPDKLVTIGENAFLGCENLNKIVVPDTVTTIGANAFSGCSKLEDFRMPASLEILGNGAFKNCFNLKKIIIPSGVKTIGQQAFMGCTAATELTFEGNNVTEIKDEAFSGCKNLTGLLNIVHGVKVIGPRAFANCGYTELQLPTSIERVEDIDVTAFDGCNITKYYALKGSAAYEWLVKNEFITSSNYEALYAIEYVNLEDDDINPNPGAYRDGEVVVFADLEREGYSFKGFYEDEACTKKITSTANKKGDLKVYLKWDAKKCKITYDLNGATTNNSKNPETVNYKNDLKLYTPYFNGYAFHHWDLVEFDEEGNERGTRALEAKKVLDAEGKETNETYWILESVKGDVTVRAVWEELSYKIVYDLVDSNAKFRDGYSPEETVQGKDGRHSLYNENAVKLAGHALIGWSTEPDGKGTVYEPGQSVDALASRRDETVTLYAVWESGCYYIKYNIGKGASVSENVIYTKVPASMTKPKKLLDAVYVTKPGYTLVGWSTTKKIGKGDTYNPGAAINPIGTTGKTITLYAVYTLDQYSIKYILPDGAQNSNKNKTEYNVKKTVSLKKPTLAGYVFVGWYKEYTPENGYKKKVTKLSKGKQTGNLTLYARFQTSITYNANGGKLTSEGKSLLKKSAKTDYDASGMIELVEPKDTEMYKNGLEFAGWNTAKDGSGTFFEKGKAHAYKDIVNACNGKKIKLYAQWKTK